MFSLYQGRVLRLEVSSTLFITALHQKHISAVPLVPTIPSACLKMRVQSGRGYDSSPVLGTNRSIFIWFDPTTGLQSYKGLGRTVIGHTPAEKSYWFVWKKTQETSSMNFSDTSKNTKHRVIGG